MCRCWINIILLLFYYYLLLSLLLYFVWPSVLKVTFNFPQLRLNVLNWNYPKWKSRKLINGKFDWHWWLFMLLHVSFLSIMSIFQQEEEIVGIEKLLVLAKFIFWSDDKDSKSRASKRLKVWAIVFNGGRWLHTSSHPFSSCKVTPASFFFFFKEIYHFSCPSLVLIITINRRGESSVEGSCPASATRSYWTQCRKEIGKKPQPWLTKVLLNQMF